MIENMVNNFAYLIDKNRLHTEWKPQLLQGPFPAPVFLIMVKLLAEEKADDVLIKYRPQLEKEYEFWMQRAERLDITNKVSSPRSTYE